MELPPCSQELLFLDVSQAFDLVKQLAELQGDWYLRVEHHPSRPSASQHPVARNILLLVKITDFGPSRGADYSSNFVGTLRYMAPELVTLPHM